VVVLSTKRHYIELNKMNPKLLLDSLKNSINFFKIANEKDEKFRYPSINFNYMPPAGASIIHPHFQVFIDDVPTYSTHLLIEKSLSYYKIGRNFWLDLIKTEKQKKVRFIKETRGFCWLADFAPRKNNEISCITKKRISCLTDFKQKDLKDLAATLSDILKRLWNRLFVRSLNMSIYSGPMNEDISEYFAVNLKIVSRPMLARNYVSDIGFMEFFHGDYVAETLPEDIAKSLR
jgi:galactose-1-phosphate uridylyltransferase